MPERSDHPLATHPPEAWRPARRAVQALFRPIERFLHIEAASGILLLGAAATALVWANSPWAESYDRLWHLPLSVGMAGWSMEHDLHFWINDLLMTAFFLLVGLEIKREMVHGALSDLRSAALPAAAAIGGMAVPAALFAALNWDGPGSMGWGVPMATDIAFAVGVLTLLGRRIHPALRVLLLAFAIIDDIGAILIIAAFYTSELAIQGLVVAGGGLLLALALLRVGVRMGPVYALPLLVMWAGLYRAGIHPTIAGVVLGLIVPAKAWYGSDGFLTVASQALDEFRSRAAAGASEHDLLEPLGRLAEAGREAVSPGVREEAALHPWVAFGVMPLFAFANAGVSLGDIDLTVPGGWHVLLGVTVGLLIGKAVGVLTASWIAIRLGLSSLPVGVTWRGMSVVAVAAGIGFTMAIFIAELAFSDPDLLAIAKLGVLVATATAGGLAFFGGRLLLREEPESEGMEVSESLAEIPAAWTRSGG